MEFNTVNGVLLPDGSINQIDIPGVDLPVWVKETFDYGDGHLNNVKGGYNNIIYYKTINGVETQLVGNIPASYANNYSGNLNCSSYWFTAGDAQAVSTSGYHNARSGGYNDIPFSVDASSFDCTVYFNFHFGYMTSSLYISELKIIINNEYLTLKQAVEKSAIKPLVIITSGYRSGNYYFSNALNTYDGGSTGSGNFPDLNVLFMINKGNVMNGIRYYSSNCATSYEKDGFDGRAYKTSEVNYYLKQN